jgi:hypothetical protein
MVHRIAALPVVTGWGAVLKEDLTEEEGGRAECVSTVEEMHLGIFEVSEIRVLRFPRANARRARKDCHHAGREVGNGCILNSTGILKKEIAV